MDTAVQSQYQRAVADEHAARQRFLHMYLWFPDVPEKLREVAADYLEKVQRVQVLVWMEHCANDRPEKRPRWPSLSVGHMNCKED